jgi:Rps23 Pro-64 3,4-dihydroxylase Tpa1-like proline 4-hydroxylase
MYTLFPQFLSHSECDNVLARYKNCEFTSIGTLQKDGSYQDNKTIRNNSQIIFDDEWLMGTLRERLSSLVRLSYIHNEFRISRYGPGQFFKPHKDGSRQQKTNTTMLISLNDDFVGGETRFWERSVKEEPQTYRPKKGSLIMFPQTPNAVWHEGCAVTKGVKFVVRGDMFVEA